MLAIIAILEMHELPFLFCNFFQKGLAKNRNALDNAIEAISQTDEHWIEIKTWRRRGMLFLEIRNPFSGKLSVSHGEQLKSTKEDVVHHGIGMESIREAVTRNLGGMDWSAKDSIFTLTVMLPVDE